MCVIGGSVNYLRRIHGELTMCRASKQIKRLAWGLWIRVICESGFEIHSGAIQRENPRAVGDFADL